MLSLLQSVYSSPVTFMIVAGVYAAACEMLAHSADPKVNSVLQWIKNVSAWGKGSLPQPAAPAVAAESEKKS